MGEKANKCLNSMVKSGQEDSSGESIRQNENRVAVSASTLNYWADLYWKYPTVHQEIYAYPLHGSVHVNNKFLASARHKSERLKQELDKDPERHRLSNEDPQIQNLKGNAANVQKSRSPLAGALTPTPGTDERRRTVNQSLVENNKAKSVYVTNVRKQTIANNRKKTTASAKGQDRGGRNDPSAALSEFRKKKGLSFSGSIITNLSDNQRSKSNISTMEEQTPVILDAIRVQRGDVESNRRSKRWARKCECCNCSNCTAPNRCKCIAFFAFITILLCLAIVAIVYPIVKVVVMYEYE